MSKFDEQLEKATKQLKECGVSVDADLLKKVAKGLGPALYNVDASLVSVSDAKEVGTVAKNFIGKKLGVTDADKATAAINKVATKMKDCKRKMRLCFYYLLTKELGKESIYG